jgi:modulator of FtsH protease
MAVRDTVLSQGVAGSLDASRVLRNTYMMLALTLLFSALMAGVAMALSVPPVMYMISTFGALGLVWFALPRTANSAAGIGVVFAFTGLLGFGLGPLLSMYLSLPNGPQLVMTALGGTGAICVGLSAYALISRRNFNFMGGFLVTGLIVVLVAALANIFLNIAGLHLVVSVMIIAVMSGFILFDTSRIIHGGETNYLMATTGLYLSIFNIFVHLLSLLGMSDD